MVLKMPFFEASLYNTIDEVICMLQHNNLEMILNFLVGLPTYVPLWQKKDYHIVKVLDDTPMKKRKEKELWAQLQMSR